MTKYTECRWGGLKTTILITQITRVIVFHNASPKNYRIRLDGYRIGHRISDASPLVSHIGVIFNCLIKMTDCSSSQHDKNESLEALEVAINKGRFFKLIYWRTDSALYSIHIFIFVQNDKQEMEMRFENYLWMPHL